MPYIIDKSKLILFMLQM